MPKRLRYTLPLLLLWLWSVTAVAQEADAVVTAETNEVHVNSDMAYTWTQHRSVLMKNERAAHHAKFYIYMRDGMTMESFQMTFSDATGKVLRTFKQKELMRSELSQGLADDGYMLMLDATPPVYPVVASFDMKVSFKRNNISLPIFSPLANYNTQVVSASYDITYPEDFSLRYKSVNTSAKPVESVSDGRRRMHFQMNDIQPVQDTEYGLPLSEQSPKVYFAPETFTYYKTTGSLATWKDLGGWICSLFQGRDALPEEAKAKVRQLVANCSTNREKVAAIYQLMASSTRYVSIQLGIGGYQPMSAAEVWKRGYGDCKALCNYMMALLAEVGVESHCVSISTQEKHLLKDFPNFQQLNHMILEVPTESDTLWVECTNPQLPLGYVHDDISGHEALEISEQGGKIVRLPEYPDSCNLNVTEVSVSLDADGTASVDITETFQYHYYGRMYSLKTLDKNDLRKLMYSLYLLPQAEISSTTVIDESSFSGLPSLKYNLKAENCKLAKNTANRLFVPINLLHKNFAPAPDSHRANELYIAHGSRQRERIVITLPQDYEIEKMPESVKLSLPFAEYTSEASLIDGKLVITNDYLRHHGVFPDAVKSFNEFERKISDSYASKIVLKRKM